MADQIDGSRKRVHEDGGDNSSNKRPANSVMEVEGSAQEGVQGNVQRNGQGNVQRNGQGNVQRNGQGNVRDVGYSRPIQVPRRPVPQLQAPIFDPLTLWDITVAIPMRRLNTRPSVSVDDLFCIGRSAARNRVVYNPHLNRDQNPHYYDMNKQLFELHAMRVQRHGLNPPY